MATCFAKNSASHSPQCCLRATEMVSKLKGICRNATSFFEWRIARAGTVLGKPGDYWVSSRHSFCGGNWTIRVVRGCDAIIFIVNKQKHVKSRSHQNVIACKLSVMKSDGKVYDPELSFTFEEDERSVIRPCNKTEFAWRQVEQKDDIKILCVLRCFDCTQELDEIISAYGRKRKETKGIKRKCVEEACGSPDLDMEFHLPGLKKLGRDFEHLLESEEGTDATVIVDDTKFKVHTTVLMARSAVWRKVWEENDSSVLDIDGCSHVAFRKFLTYTYSGNLDVISVDSVVDLHQLAETYAAEDLREKCVKFMADNLSIELFFDTLYVSLKRDLSELEEKTVAFFSEHKLDILITPKWIHFQRENPVAANELHIKATKYEAEREGPLD